MSRWRDRAGASPYFQGITKHWGKEGRAMSRLSRVRFHGVRYWLGAGLLMSAPLLVCGAARQALSAQTSQPPSTQNVKAPSRRVKLMERKPLELSPEEQRAAVLMARQEYAAAIDAYLALHSRSAIVWNQIGMAYHHLFALEEARKAYLEALAINPHFAPAANNLAAVYYGQHNFKEAEHYYKKALKYSSEDAVIYCNLGTAYFAEKRYGKGKKEYRKAFELDHDVFSPREAAIVEAASSREQRIALNYYLAQTYAEAGDQEHALNFLRKALDEGFNDRKRLIEDKEFAVLRTTAQFRDLLASENLN